MFSVFRNINRFAGKLKLLDAFAIFCARYLLYLLMIFLLAVAIAANNWRVFFYPLLSGSFAAFVLNKIIYIFYKGHRPAVFQGVKVLILVPKNPSFPSRHASLLFGMSFYLFFYNAPLATIFLIFSCIVGVARVFSGVHWFRDIVAGAFMGFISALIVNGILNNIII